MSYNITAWKQTKCENFRINAEGIELLIEFGSDISYDAVETMKGQEPSVIASGGSEGFALEGHLDSVTKTLVVTKLRNYGEGSGSMYDFIKDAFGHSTGEYEAVLVWEGGDSIRNLMVKDGVISEIDLLK